MTLDQIRELVEARTNPAGGVPFSKKGEGGPPDSANATVALSPTSSPDRAAAAAAAAAAAQTVVTTAAAAAAAAPKVALAEIGFPEVLPPRQPLATPSFVRIVDV